MRTLAVLLIAILGVVAPCSHADQTDPGLGPLFAALAAAGSPREAARIESGIWARWLQSGDPQTDELLAAAIDASDRGRVGFALELLDEVVERAPQFAEGWNQRATARFLVEDYAGALADIERVLELEPRHFGALSGRGLIHLRMGRDYQALLAFEAVLRINPQARQARRYVRFLRQRLGAETV
jgi:tetratricopeptide (TPR) repeat protein